MKAVEKFKVLERITAPAIRIRYQAYFVFNGSVHDMEQVTGPNVELKLKRSI